MSLKCSSREISSIKRRNSKGPRIDPWGTPHFTGAGSDIVFLIFTDCLNYKQHQAPRLETKCQTGLGLSLKWALNQRLYSDIILSDH